jgi:hypothetical protein
MDNAIRVLSHNGAFCQADLHCLAAAALVAVHPSPGRYIDWCSSALLLEGCQPQCESAVLIGSAVFPASVLHDTANKKICGLCDGLPVRSALFKQDTGGLVVRWVTTGESPLLYVFDFCFIY